MNTPSTAWSPSRDFKRVGVVNRGEPAVRFLRALRDYNRERGTAIEGVALYTDPDRGAPFLRLADRAVGIGPALVPVAGKSGLVSAYTDHARILDALERAGCDAVWPGWGFVSEDASFVEALETRGIAFIGPPSAAMRRLGDKIAAKLVASESDVPMAPWHLIPDDEPLEVTLAAGHRVGFPLVVKASAGGGGRGIRVVTDPALLASAIVSVRDEAARSFGKGGLFLEACVTSARHIEVQLVVGADGVGAAVGLRDCSIQRKHQKVIEEAPSPVLSRAVGERLLASAIRLGENVAYRGVGTVEFLVDPARDFAHFLEVNTRLQVEHTVTEAVTGLDLVHVQLDIARGLPWDPEAAAGTAPPFTTPAATYARTRGHAVEVRLNAEDPERDFQPSPGRIQVFRAPMGPGIRVDSGVAEGVTIAPEFDSMIAKVIAHGRDRGQALARLARALRELEVAVEDGQTNKAFLTSLIAVPEVVLGTADTGWLDREMAKKKAKAPPDQTLPAAAPLLPGTFEAFCVAAILVRKRSLDEAIAAFQADVQSGIPYRFDVSRDPIALSLRGLAVSFEAHAIGPGRWLVGPVAPPGMPTTAFFEARLGPGPGGPNSFELHLDDGRTTQRHEVLAVFGKAGLGLEIDGQSHTVELAAGGQVKAPAPALVVGVHVAEGQVVAVGDRLCTLEAMKMEVPVLAREPGVIRRVICRPNEQVQAGQALFEVEPVEPTSADNAAPTQPRVRPRPPFPEPAPRALGLLFNHKEPDPSAISRLAPELAQAALDDLLGLAEALLSGWEVPPALQARVEALLGNEDAFRVLADPSVYKPLTRLLGRFADLEYVFARELETDTGRPLPARLAFFEACRRLAPSPLPEVPEDLLHPELRRRLLRALAPHGVATLHRSPLLSEALWRIAAAHADPGARHRLTNSLMRALLALHDAGLDLDDDSTVELWLARVAEVARPELPGLRDNARQARYVLFRRQRMPGRADPLLALRLVHLGDPDPDPYDDLEETPLEVAVDNVLRAVYGQDADLEPLPAGLGVECRSVMGHGGVRSVAAVVSGALASRAVGSLTPTLLAFSRDNPGARYELHLFLSGSVTSPAEALLPPLLEALTPPLDALAAAAGAHRPTRIAVAWTPDGAREHHRSWKVNGQLTPERDLDDLHPERARRLELWRLAEFHQDRLHTTHPLLAIRGRARANPRDERVFVFAELSRAPNFDRPDDPAHRELEWIFAECLRVLREAQASREASQRYFLNRIILHVGGVMRATNRDLVNLARRMEGATRGHGLQKVVVQAHVERDGQIVNRVLSFAMRGRSRLEVHEDIPSAAPIRAASDYHVRVERARRLGTIYPYEIIRTLEGTAGADLVSTPHPDMAHGRFEELDLDPSGTRLVPVDRAPGENKAAIVVGLVTHHTRKHPDGMTRVFLASDPTTAMGALSEPECRRVLAALDLAEEMRVPVEWIPVSSGAKIAMDSGTENLDWTARVLARIIEFTQAGGEINIIVAGVNVGAQSYWNAEATMLMHTRGVLIQTGEGSMVLTGKKALEVSGSVAADDERGIGGYDRVMGPNGQAQHKALHLGDAFRILFTHYAFTYVAPGERAPRRFATTDSPRRNILLTATDALGEGLATIGDLFSEATNPGRKKPFSIREVMRAAIDQDGGHLEKLADMEGGETAAVWDAHIGGHPVCLIGFESKNLDRKDKAPLDGPERWSGGTLFPQSSKKVARGINQASGNRPVVVLANLSGFDGSPESMRKLQLEYGAEIGRAVVNFRGPIIFTVIGRYHGGAYVVFSKALNPGLVAFAVDGAFASVIGGAPAAAVVFPREVRSRAMKDPRVVELRQALDALDEPRVSSAGGEGAPPEVEDEERLAEWRAVMQAEYDRVFEAAILEHQGRLAKEFDAIHSVERAVKVGSLDAVIAPENLRASIIEVLDRRAERPITWKAPRPAGGFARA